MLEPKCAVKKSTKRVQLESYSSEPRNTKARKKRKRKIVSCTKISKKNRLHSKNLWNEGTNCSKNAQNRPTLSKTAVICPLVKE